MNVILLVLDYYEFNLTHMKIKYIHSHYEVDISNEEAEYYEKTVSQIVGHCFDRF